MTENIFPYVVGGGILALVGLVIYVSWRLDKKRTEALATVATTFGMQFSERSPLGLLVPYADLHLFTLGRNGTARNVMRGEVDGVTVSAFDYSYVTGGGRSRQTHRQTVATMSLPALALPGFELRPENIFHKIGSALGFQDIDFPEAPVFSKAFLLRGAEEAAIRSAFRSGVLSFFERHQGTSAEGRGRNLVYYRASRTLKPAEVRAFLNDGRELARLFVG